MIDDGDVLQSLGIYSLKIYSDRGAYSRFYRDNGRKHTVYRGYPAQGKCGRYDLPGGDLETMVRSSDFYIIFSGTTGFCPDTGAKRPCKRSAGQTLI
jgi:hypothetical protein